jgi:hypothetical protein
MSSPARRSPREPGRIAAARRLLARYREIASRGEALAKRGRGRRPGLRTVEPHRRPAYKYNGTWVIDELSRIGLHVTQRVLPTGPYGEALRNGDCDLTLDGHCQNVVNPLLDVGKYLPHSVSTENYENTMTSGRSISITRYFGKQTSQSSAS